MTAAHNRSRRQPGLGNLLHYMANHAHPCCVPGDDDPDPSTHDPSCWFPTQIEWMERMEVDHVTRTQRSRATQQQTPVTPSQERTLWHLYRSGMLDTFSPAPDDCGSRIGWQSIDALTLKGLVESHRFETWTVRGIHEYRSGTQEYRSPVMWDARLTRAGQEWIAERMCGKV